MNANAIIESLGIVPVINIPDPVLAIPLAEALIAGGLPVIEVTLRCETALQSIRNIKASCPQMLVGAGTITSVQQAEDAMRAGADFIVSPGYDQELVDFCIERDVTIYPGCTTAAEIQAAYRSGLRVVKFFPADVCGGLQAIRAFAGPFGEMRFLPTCGINMGNLGDYLACDKVIACGGSFMAPAAMLAAGEFAAITDNCRKAVDVALGFTLAHVGINCGDSEQAEKTARLLGGLLHMPVRETGKSFFTGSVVENMKIPFYGEKGHIGIRTLSMTRALAWLEKVGAQINEQSRQYDAKGELSCVYLKEEIAGFAIHFVK